jgi:hypothetical protein
MRVIAGFIVALLFMVSCNSGQKSVTHPGIHEAVVQEVLQAGQYTYLRVKEADAELWIAVTAIQAEVGKTYYYKDGMEMKNFHSKELNRDFPLVYFINDFSTDPEMKTTNSPIPGHGQTSGMNNETKMQPQKPVLEKQNIRITPVAGGITIADLFSKKDKYSGKSVKIKGQVVKFNPEIMNKNWIHIQDGTENDGVFDLTVTTTATVKVGDVITVEGKVALDKDFGAGYVYSVIVEDATIK